MGFRKPRYRICEVCGMAWPKPHPACEEMKYAPDYEYLAEPWYFEILGVVMIPIFWVLMIFFNKKK